MILESIEKKQNIKLPETLFQSDFKEIYAGIEIQAGDDVFCINKFWIIRQSFIGIMSWH